MAVYEVDLDGVLCNNTYGKYKEAKPIMENIKKVNKLFELGHTININTGRGSTTGIDWRYLTEVQLKRWNVKYHKLTVGEKPYYDFIIDDKSINYLQEDWSCV